MSEQPVPPRNGSPKEHLMNHPNLSCDCAPVLGHPISGSRWAYAFLPYLLTTSFPLAILLWNVGDMPSVATIVATIGLLLFFVALLDVLLRFFVRRSPYRELLLCTAIAFVMGYGHVGNLLWNLGLRRAYFVPAWCVLFLILVILIVKNSRSGILPRAALLLQYIFTALVCLQIAWLGTIFSRELLHGGKTASSLAAMKKEASPAVPLAELPDIYCIILDGYGREDVLRQSFQFDNRDFLESLRKRGFYVVDRSRPNYVSTGLSLASSLNMRYLNDLGLFAYNTLWPLSNLIQRNEVARCLKQHGYSTVAVQSGYPLTECPSFDRYIVTCPFILNEFQAALYRTTFIYHLQYLTSRWTGSLHTSQRRLMLGGLSAIPKAVQDCPSPCFVFAHILLAHPPFIFDAQGRPLELSLKDLYDGTQNRTQYAGQIAFGNTQVLNVIDTIRSTSRRPALIILQGDHGPGPEWFNAHASDAERQSERSANLNAICLPPGVDVGLYDTMTPVNTFRLIFDHYFNTKLGRLEDYCYYSKYSTSYAFQKITSETHEIVADRRK